MVGSVVLRLLVSCRQQNLKLSEAPFWTGLVVWTAYIRQLSLLLESQRPDSTNYLLGRFCPARFSVPGPDPAALFVCRDLVLP